MSCLEWVLLKVCIWWSPFVKQQLSVFNKIVVFFYFVNVGSKNASGESTSHCFVELPFYLWRGGYMRFFNLKHKLLLESIKAGLSQYETVLKYKLNLLNTRSLVVDTSQVLKRWSLLMQSLFFFLNIIYCPNLFTWFCALKQREMCSSLYLIHFFHAVFDSRQFHYGSNVETQKLRLEDKRVQVPLVYCFLFFKFPSIKWFKSFIIGYCFVVYDLVSKWFLSLI